MHCWNSIVVGPRLLVSPSPSTSVGMLSYQPYLVLAMCYLQVRQPPPPPSCHIPPSAALINPWRAVGLGRGSPCCSSPPVSFALSSHPSAVSPDTGACCAVFLVPGVRLEPGRGRSRGKERSGLLSLLRSLRLVLPEQSLIGPSALSGTLLPGLNNECAELPLALRALIISQGPVFCHVQGIRG